jgi:signal transduction histidine kinase
MLLPCDGGALAVLLVGSVPETMETVREAIQCGAPNARVVHVRHATAAVEPLDRDAFDVVLLDLAGQACPMEAITCVTEAAGEVPVVVLGNGDTAQAAQYFEAGAEDCLHSSEIDPARLVRALTHAVARARAHARTVHRAESQRLTAIGHLAAGVAHEVNNPIASVLLNLEMIGRHADILRRREATGSEAGTRGNGVLDQISGLLVDSLGEVARIAAVARHLKMFTRPRPATLEAVDLEHVCHLAARLARPELEGRARLVLDVSGAPPLLSDGSAIAEIIRNLLLNAAEATKTPNAEENEIRVRVETSARWVTLEVEDRGQGVAPETLPEIFAPFYSTKAPSRHRGLGLSVCVELVEQLGGRLKLTNRPGGGTRARVMLPRKHRERAARRHAS